MIPFFVVDRQASLRILQGSGLEQYDIKVGLMSHANTSTNFQEFFSLYPCVNTEYCEVIEGNCPYEKRIECCQKGTAIKERILKMCDSGIFQKNGCSFNYSELFAIYEKMKPKYGIMIDYLKQKDKTLNSAKDALKEYTKGKYSFGLVGVAQGETLEEYIECYNELKKMGYSCIAIGGLIVKTNSVRYVRVGNEQLMSETLSTLRGKNPRDWLFALGCYHPRRHDLFHKLGIFGSDYKGWIFNYDRGRKKTKDPPNEEKTILQKRRFEQTRAFVKGIYKITQDRADGARC